MTDPEHHDEPPTEHTAEPTTDVTVEVATPTDPPEPPVEPEHTTVVVEDSGDTGIHPTVAAFMADQAGTNERLLAYMDNTANLAAAAADTAANASATVEDAVSEVEAVGSEVAATVAEHKAASTSSTPDEDEDPKNSVHRWYRKGRK